MRALVVGAGIYGASTAYSLARGGAQVTVVDQVHQGKATLAGAGIVCPWGSRQTDPAFSRYHIAGADYYHRLIPELEAMAITDTGYARVGGLVLAETDAQMAEIEQRVLPRTKVSTTAGGTSRVDSKGVRELFPPLRDGLAGLFIEGGARVEARTLAGALLDAARKMGAEVRQGHVALSTGPGGVTAEVEGRALPADAVVVTAGAWANDILTAVGRPIPVAPQRGQIAHLRLEGVDTGNWPTLQPQDSHYMLAFDEGRIVAGATRETGSGFDYRLTAAGQREVLDFALALAPGLADATHIETRIGFRPAIDRLLPIVTDVPEIPRLYLGNGLGAGGLTMGAWSGHLLAQLVLGETPDVDLSLLGVPA